MAPHPTATLAGIWRFRGAYDVQYPELGARLDDRVFSDTPREYL
jgi:hypothetical protein